MHGALMAGGLGTYILQLWKKASKGSVLLTDTLSIVTVPLVTLTYWGLEKLNVISSSVDIEVGELVSFVVVFSIIGIILLRFLASPYLVWVDQNQLITTLNTRLAEPEMIERRWLSERVAKSKSDLVKDLAIMIKLTADEYLWRQHPDHENKPEYQKVKRERVEQFLEAQERAHVGINELGYLPQIRKLGYDLSNACDRLIVGYKEGADPRPVKKEIYECRDTLFPRLHHHKTVITVDN